MESKQYPGIFFIVHLCIEDDIKIILWSMDRPLVIKNIKKYFSLKISPFDKVYLLVTCYISNVDP